MKIVNGSPMSDKHIHELVNNGYTVAYVDTDSMRDEKLNSYTVVLNAPTFNEGLSHVACVETKIFARDIDDALALARLLKFEVHLEITSISKDR